MDLQGDNETTKSLWRWEQIIAGFRWQEMASYRHVLFYELWGNHGINSNVLIELLLLHCGKALTVFSKKCYNPDTKK